MNSKVYRNLPDPATSIRLLRIEPGWPADPLSVQLTVVPDRNTAPSYDALSYVWGKELSPNPILCNGSSITITANLESALRALRLFPAIGDPGQHGVNVIGSNHLLHSRKRAWRDFAHNCNEIEVIESRRAKANPNQETGFIWIDALCINQADLQECAEQVKGMRGIYKSSKVVRIWLGTTLVTAEGVPRVFPDMKTGKLDAALGRVRLTELGHMPVILSFLAQALRNEARRHENTGYNAVPGATLEGATLEATVETEQGTLDLVGFPPSHAPEWAIFAGFLEQPWFHRVWIVQEVVMAQDAKVVMGDWEMEWEPFARAIDILDDAMLSISHSMKMRSSEELWEGLPLLEVRYLCHIRRLPGRTNYLLPLLNDSRQRKATKPADHVFAVLGMASEVVNPDPKHADLSRLVTVDYTKPTAHVFRDATWFILLSHATLLPLTMVELSDSQSMEDCPSWVPLWTEPRKTLRLHQELFNSNFGKKMHLDYHDDNTLRVSGYSFERVQALSPGLKASSQTTANMSSNNAWHYPPHDEEIEFVTSAWNLAESFQVTIPEQARTLQRPYQSGDAMLEAFVYTLCGNRNEATDNGRADASSEVLNSAKAWLEKFVRQFSQSTSFLNKIWHSFLEAMYPGNGLSFQACLLRACISRRFFMTSSGFMGIGPESMKEGDLVVVIFGLSLPFVLRQSQTDADKFLVVGPCYVHGIMEGELVIALEGQSPKVFTLV
ncbi:heterokaryon incompatibility [Fusarium albosuccineum]|uniref:Heterokaryon incompatibility n=1 Tax=Fusarium albosuccineum TaxID=1237068 RepID=A0A8H4LIQ3_9HYPO|nr:heterokaryon incompatibility [Fusarium albosuccineum]